MKVGYRPVWAVVLLVVGALLVLIAALGRADVIQLAAGILCCAVGVVMLTRAYFEFEPETKTIVFKALLSTQVRRFGGADGGRLDVVDNRIVCVRSNGSQRELPVKSYVAKKTEWDAVLARITDTRT